MQDYSVERVRQILAGPIFEGLNEILLLGKALKFRVNFQKYALRLIKFLKLLRNFEKNAYFSEFFDFRGMGK